VDLSVRDGAGRAAANNALNLSVLRVKPLANGGKRLAARPAG